MRGEYNMYKERIKNIREFMEKKAFEAILLIGDANRNYMSGFTGDESFAVITLDKAIFITDSRFTEQARQQVEDFEVRQYERPFSTYLAKLIEELGVKNLAFEDEIMTVSDYNMYSKELKIPMVSQEGIVEALRIVKNESEADSIRKAAAIADEAFEHMLRFIRCGMSEREIGLELEFFMKKKGATALSFPSIVASGVRSSLPHGEPTDKIVSNGEFLTLDFGCVYSGYCSDMTRTIVIGEPSEKMLEVYNVVLEAQEKALVAIKPGITGAELDKIAREHIISKGYGEYFGHGLGHGVGRLVHEMPNVNSRGNEALRSGMVITDEPGIYIPDFGGVRIEDLVLVTEDGCEVLSKSPKALICI